MDGTSLGIVVFLGVLTILLSLAHLPLNKHSSDYERQSFYLTLFAGLICLIGSALIYFNE